MYSRVSSDEGAEGSKEHVIGKWKTDVIEERLGVKAELRTQPYFFLLLIIQCKRKQAN